MARDTDPHVMQWPLPPERRPDGHQQEQAAYRRADQAHDLFPTSGTLGILYGPNGSSRDHSRYDDDDIDG